MTREEQLREAANSYAFDLDEGDLNTNRDTFIAGAEWADEHLWKDAQGEDLPPIDKEVVVLCDDYHGGYKVCFGHRPCRKGYLGKSMVTGNVETFYPHTYDKGKWNIPCVRWWLDVSIPNLEEQQ